MEVQVEHALSCLLSDIGHDAIAVKPQLLGDLGNYFKNVSHHGAVFGVHCCHRGNMFLGDHQKMGRSLGGNVIKAIAKLVLINLIGGDLTCRNRAEQTIILHVGTLLSDKLILYRVVWI